MLVADRSVAYVAVFAVTNSSRTSRRRINKLTYEVSCSGPLPTDLVETISAAHAKVLMISETPFVTVFEDPKNQDVDSSAEAPDLGSEHDASAD